MDSFAKETLPISLEEEMRRSYLDYAMSVIVGRALPDVRDGLKPVHRRVLFAMHEANNVWNRSYVKCARVVGEVLGKYHPHGDTATYDALVRMAQDFSLRYLLIDGQGNFGSVDGDNAAAYRYTECRLNKLASELLVDIEKETVDFVANYDGKEQEPTVLPSRVPNLLINGSGGIAVGMATNIPPHNLSEVVDGCLLLLRNPDATIDELIELIPAPDFPTAGIIYGLEGVREGYRTGRGRCVMRAKTHFEEIDKGARSAIIVDELPYQVNKRALLERIADMVNEKKIEGISDIRDESDKSGMRAVFELKRGEVPEIVLNNLFKLTQLQDTFGMNLVALVDGQPRLLNLKQIIEAFLSHRREVVTRRTVFELREARRRGHVLEGLAVALASIDDFIAIIKAAPTPPVAKAELVARNWDSPLVREMMARAAQSGTVAMYRPEGLDPALGPQEDGTYRLSEEQAEQILQMRLQRLTGLEQDKIVGEYRDVMALIGDLIDVLARPERITTIIHDELVQVRAISEALATGGVGAALISAMNSSMLASATARPSSTWPRLRASRRSNTVRRVTTSRRCARKASMICLRLSSRGWPSTSATRFMPKVSCSCVSLYRLLSTTSGSSPRLSSNTARMPDLSDSSRISEMPSIFFSLTISAMRSSSARLLTW